MVHCVNYGEVIKRDNTVSIQCISIQRGLSYCGWSFQATYGLKVNQIDFKYIPFNAKAVSTISIQPSIENDTNCICTCIGGKDRKTIVDYSSFADLYSFLRIVVYMYLIIETQKDDNRNTLIISSITDSLMEVIEAVLHGRVYKGKPLPVYFMGKKMWLLMICR